jgi:SSS family solute:Na+ symporter
MFETFDLIVFVASLFLVMIIGLLAARHSAGEEETSEDYFLAGRNIPWWGVAGSIFGTNVSANHIVGMLGVGYSIGFAQSHFELGAVAGLLILAYLFLPVYMNLKIYTLSEYLGKRYNDLSRLLYTCFLIILILVQMIAAFYIGSRSLMLLLRDTPLEIGYTAGVAILVLITSAYTIFGGLKAVVWTDVIQSVLLLVAGIMVAVLTFAQPEVGGWSGMMATDALAGEARKMQLYLPTDHPELPWSGALSGLLILHVFYWSTNQYIVQRAMGARSLSEARIGIFVGNSLKLMVPFFSIAGGVAAAHLFAARIPAGQVVAPDEAFPILVNMVAPAGYGIIGIILAGLLGAIISSIDSMMNSAATLVTMDVYRKYARPDADDHRLIRVGQIAIVAIVGISAFLALTTYDPNSTGNFFLKVSSQSSHFTPGLVAAFLLGMFDRRATATGAIAAILATPILSFGGEALYREFLAAYPGVVDVFGTKLNFMHRVAFVFATTLLIHFVVSRLSVRDTDGDKTPFLWINASGANPAQMRKAFYHFLAFLVFQAIMAACLQMDLILPTAAAYLSSAFTLTLFVLHIRHDAKHIYQDDRFYAGLVSAATMFIMYYFY